MTPARQISREDYGVFWQKAKEFRRLMEHALAQTQWNSLGLAAVHCAISANDALLAFYGGRKASGSDHREAIGLLHKFIPDPEAAKKAEHLKRIIVKKNLIEYDGKLFPAHDAKEIYKNTVRFYEWAASMIDEDI